MAEPNQGLLLVGQAPRSPARPSPAQATPGKKASSKASSSSSHKGTKSKKAAKAMSKTKHLEKQGHLPRRAKKGDVPPSRPSPLPLLQLDITQGPFSQMLPINTSGLWGDVAPRTLCRTPEATFTPPAAGLWQE